MCGLNVAQVKGGIYADASAALVGSAVFEKGKDPQFNLDGSLNLSIGIMLGFYSRLYAKTSLGNFGYDAELSKKWELLSWGLSSVGCSGVIKEPSQRIGGEDMPLSEVKVTLKKDSSTVADQVVYSDADGKYSFKNLAKGTYTLIFEKDGYVKKEEKKVVISNQSVKKNISLSLEKYIELDGTVVAASDNHPISGVGLTLVKASDSSIVKYATTDAGGAYKFGIKDDGNKGLTPGVYKLTAKKNGYREVKQDVAVTVSDTGEITIDPIQMLMCHKVTHR